MKEKENRLDFLSEMEEVKMYGGQSPNPDGIDGINMVAGCENNNYCGNCTIQCGCSTHSSPIGCTVK